MSLQARRMAKASGVGVAMFAAAGVFVYPFFWMFLGSFKSNVEIYDTTRFWPSEWSWSFYGDLFSGKYFDFGGSLLNSCLIAGLQAAFATFIASLAGFTLGVYRFPARRGFLMIGVALVIVPTQVLALPIFSWINRIGAFDTPWGVALPGMASGLGLLFFSRVYGLVPKELLDAARVEGASEARLYWMSLPLVKPFIAAFCFLQFVLAWHAHIVPLLILHSDEQRTLPLSLAALASNSMRTPQGVLMATSVLGMLPLAFAFLLVYPLLKTALRDFVRG